MAFWQKKSGNRIFVYFWDKVAMKQRSLPRDETRQLDLLTPDEIEGWVRDWELRNNLAGLELGPEPLSDPLWIAEHYGTAIIPTRAYKPRDKAKVEVGVQVAQRWILAILRRQTFTSIAEINSQIQILLDRLNNLPPNLAMPAALVVSYDSIKWCYSSETLWRTSFQIYI